MQNQTSGPTRSSSPARRSSPSTSGRPPPTPTSTASPSTSGRPPPTPTSTASPSSPPPNCNLAGIALLGQDSPGSNLHDLEPSNYNLGQINALNIGQACSTSKVLPDSGKQAVAPDLDLALALDLDLALDLQALHLGEVLDWASAPEDGAWAAGDWGAGKWNPVLPGSEKSSAHWCKKILNLKGMIDKSTYYKLKAEERLSAVRRLGYPETELQAIESFYLPYSFWLEDNRERYIDPDNVVLCRLYEDFREVVMPDLCLDIYNPDSADRSPKILHKLSQISQKVNDVTRSIQSRGNSVMPIPYQWWIDLNARRREEFAIASRARKINMGKND